jgi:hypothetical protein
MTAEGFVEHLRTRLTEAAAHFDRTRPENREPIINERGEPALKRLRAKARPLRTHYPTQSACRTFLSTSSLTCTPSARK